MDVKAVKGASIGRCGGGRSLYAWECVERDMVVERGVDGFI